MSSRRRYPPLPESCRETERREDSDPAKCARACFAAPRCGRLSDACPGRGESLSDRRQSAKPRAGLPAGTGLTALQPDRLRGSRTGPGPTAVRPRSAASPAVVTATQRLHGGLACAVGPGAGAWLAPQLLHHVGMPLASTVAPIVNVQSARQNPQRAVVPDLVGPTSEAVTLPNQCTREGIGGRRAST